MTVRRKTRDDRGVALLITLMVTALLIALVFEFAYGTRVSLRGAANFRDSQRAYYLARSGVNLAGRFLADILRKGKSRDYLQQDWQPVPVIGTGDTVVMFRWEDEAGKIKIGPAPMDLTTQDWFKELLTNTGVDQEVARKIFDTPGVQIRLVSDLHQYMTDADYEKVKDFVTVSTSGAIDVNTATETVLRSVLRAKKTTPDFILANRRDAPIASLAETDINTSLYTTTSDVFHVYSYATVGGYTKQAEAVITRFIDGRFTIQYRKIL